MSSEAINTSVRRRRLRETMGKVIIVALGLTAASFFLTSCGVKKSLNPNSTSSANGARSYLPIQTGYSATFSVTDTIGQEIRQESFSATSGSSFQGREGVRWEGQNLTDTTIATGGVLFWDDQGVYLQADGASAAEVLLASPLEKGADWPRWRDFSAPVIIDVGAGSLVLDSSASGLGVNIGGGANGNEPTFSSSFPTSGSSTFYVASLDDVVISGGRTYTDCLQVVNAGVGEKVNRYWYHPGGGLVKYALGCQFGDLTGAENAELVMAN